MSQSRRIASVVLAVIASMMLGATGSGRYWRGSAQAATPIKFGVIMDASGAASYTSQLAVRGAKLAADDINAHGGIGGRNIELLFEDDRNDPALSDEKARKFASEKDVVAIIGASGSASALQNQKVTEEERIPQISPTNIVKALTAHFLKYFFRLSPTDADFFEFTIKTAGKYSKIAIFTDTTQTGLATANLYADTFRKRGLNLVAMEQVDTGATDATPQILRMKNAGAQLVMLLVQGVPEEALAARTIAQINWHAQEMGTPSIGVPAFAALAKAAANGVTFFDTIDDSKPAFQAYKKKWSAKYGQEVISSNSTEAYDAVNLLVEAIKRGGGATRGKIRSGLEGINHYVAVTGRAGSYVHFSATSHQGLGIDAVTLRVYKNGQPTLYQTH